MLKYGLVEIGAHWTTTSGNSHVPLISSPPPIPLITMPRSIITCPPGGAMGKVCSRYTVVQKLCLLEEANQLRQVSNLSLQGTTAELGVCHSLLVKWKKDLPCLQSSPWSKKWSNYAGPNVQFHPIENELLMWIFVRLKMGVSIKNMLIFLKALLLLLLWRQEH